MPAKDIYPGLGGRLLERLKAVGYWNEDRNRPDLLRFAMQKGYVSQYLYAWTKDDRMPTYEYIVKLAKDLEVPAAWLLFGDDGVKEAAEWWGEHGKGRGARRRR